MRKRKALIMLGPRVAILQDEPLADLRPNQVILRSLMSSFKHGTEISAYLGTNPFATKRLDRKWRVFTEQPTEDAPPPYPRQLGNMTVGEIESCGSDVQGLSVGERVFGWLPVADRHVCDADSVRPLDGMTPEQALCIDPASFGLGGVLDGDVRIGENILITGLGAIGLMAIQYCKLRGATVYAASGFALRRELAVRYGADFVLDRNGDDDLGLKVKQMTDGGLRPPSNAREPIHTFTRQCAPHDSAGASSASVFIPAVPATCGLARSSTTTASRCWRPCRLLPGTTRCAATARFMRTTYSNWWPTTFGAGRLSADGLLRPTLPFAKSVQAIETICSRPEDVVKVAITY